MVFSSTLFLFIFLPSVLLVYFLIPYRFLFVKNMVLLAASLFFYSWGEPRIVLLMMLSVCVNFILSVVLEKVRSQIGRCICLILSVLYNLGILFVFKYTNFFFDNISHFFKVEIGLYRFVLPIGISFYTFQILSYVVDVYRKKVKAEKNILYLALYVSFFPQLIAGPIVRYVDIAKNIVSRKFNPEQTASGLRRFVMGFAKKVLIANSVAVVADKAFSSTSELSCAMAWIGLICYALQIYYDFSAYSDMAIGMGRIFGFEFLENFNYPYISASVKEFWRRWHMSLSTWFRDYLYIPLGGNKKGLIRTYINLVIVFAATGLWHGAAWTFVIWGFYHGVFLVLERAFLGKLLENVPRFFGVMYSLLVVLMGWVLFRSNSLSEALLYMAKLFSFDTGGWSTVIYAVDKSTWVFILSGIFFCAPVIPYVTKLTEYKYRRKYLPTFFSCCTIVIHFFLLLLSIVFLSGSDYNPFIYYRF